MHGATKPGRTVAALALGFAASWSITSVGSVADRLAQSYGVRLAAIGLLTSALFVCHTAVQLPAGRAIDRFGARGVGIASLLVVAAGNGIALSHRGFWVALLARAVTGLGTGAGFLAGSDYVRASGGGALLQGVYGGFTLGATGFAVAVVPQLAGWRAPYWTGLVITLPVVLALAAIPSARRPPQRRSHVPVLSDRRLHRLSLLHACSFGISIVAGSWVVSLLVRDGFSHRTAGLAGALTLIGGLATRPAGGFILQRRPVRMRTAAAASLATCSLGLALLSTRAPLPVLVLAALVVGIAAGLPFSSVFTGAAVLRPDAPGAAIGVVNAGANLFILIAVPLVGLTFSLPGEGRLGFAALAVVGAIGLALLPPASSLGVQERS